MMKLLLAVIATCALVVSPTCIKIKHQLRSNAPTIHVLISNGNTQMTSQVGRNGSHRFITDNLSSMTLAPAGTQTITLSYDEIFPITNAAVCTEVHPLSAGGCADGVCCKISISMYTITDAIIMTARVNNRKADGNPQFWKCEQEIQVPGVTNTEPTGEELAAEILQGEEGYPCSWDGHCVDQVTGVYTGYRCDSGQCTNACNTVDYCIDPVTGVIATGYMCKNGQCTKQCGTTNVYGICKSDAACNTYGGTYFGGDQSCRLASPFLICCVVECVAAFDGECKDTCDEDTYAQTNATNCLDKTCCVQKKHAGDDCTANHDYQCLSGHCGITLMVKGVPIPAAVCACRGQSDCTSDEWCNTSTGVCNVNDD